jgi:hypothetical protein
MQIGRQWELDLGGCHLDSVPHYPLPPHFELDARLALRPGKHRELPIVGKYLLGAQHPEYDTALYRRMSELERSALLIARTNFSVYLRGRRGVGLAACDSKKGRPPGQNRKLTPA